jgi:hypothetical protein
MSTCSTTGIITDGDAQPPRIPANLSGLFTPEPLGLTGRQLATKLDVSSSTVAHLLAGKSDVTREMTLRLPKT